MKRIAIVDKSKCMNDSDCPLFCAKFCPVNRTGKKCITENPENKKAMIDENLCIGCNICVKKCPYGALDIINLPTELSKDPLFRYSENGFALYNLPLPKKGKIVGILGRNGIGKSTSIKILSGGIKPNLGKLSQDVEFEDIKEYFKGSEMVTYLKDMYDAKQKVALKPQNIKEIPKIVKGTVFDLLCKYDDFEKYLDMMDLLHLKDREVSVLSGGELQRLAIVTTMLKDADIYILDEPSSFLDIKQRLKLSTFLRSLLNENKSIIVIEHDLIVLDYLCDLVHITFGKPGAYGVVSSLYNSKMGINSFLDGFLKAENMRFRDYKISFLKPPEFSATKNDEHAVEWDEFNVKFETFNLEVTEGYLGKRDVVGIVGENGTGKSTFMNKIAGKYNNDEESELKVSYKPQYLEINEDLPVRLFLRDAIAKHSKDIVRPLSIEPLFDKTLSQLSGGELQRVHVAKCLSDDSADFYLLDEPSAYLDVEQKVVLGKILRDFNYNFEKPLLVIDHDLMLIDYISDKLIIFSGEPGRNCKAEGPFEVNKGMNHFLKDVGVTFRRDEVTHRPRPNKVDSQKDKEMKRNKTYY